MMKMLLTAAAIALLTTCYLPAQAAPSTELNVAGKITPPACAPVLSGSGVIDYGVIPASSLPAGNYKTLDKRQISFEVTCESPVKLAMRLTDNRRSSTVPGITSKVSYNPAERFNFGLGLVAGKKVGGYVIVIDDAASLVDGARATNIHSSDRQGWAPAHGLDADHYFSLSSGDGYPAKAKTFKAVFNIQAVLNKPEELPLAQDVPLDGSTTIEISYL